MVGPCQFAVKCKIKRSSYTAEQLLVFDECFKQTNASFYACLHDSRGKAEQQHNGLMLLKQSVVGPEFQVPRP
jgi:hypothetical protein